MLDCNLKKVFNILLPYQPDEYFWTFQKLCSRGSKREISGRKVRIRSTSFSTTLALILENNLIKNKPATCLQMNRVDSVLTSVTTAPSLRNTDPDHRCHAIQRTCLNKILPTHVSRLNVFVSNQRSLLSVPSCDSFYVVLRLIYLNHSV